MRPSRAALVVLIVALLGAPDAAPACTCVSLPLCESLWRASTDASTDFVEATVDAVEQTPAAAIVRLRDVRAVRGQAVAVVETPASDDSCGVRFAVGTRYLIEAMRRSDGQAVTSSCSHTAPLADAREQTAYLESLSQPAPGARVYGRAIASVATSAVFGDSERTPLAGVQVRLSGPVSRSTATRADGTFTFDGLPPGRYRLSAETDAQLKLPAWPGDAFALPNAYACHESTVFLARPRRQ
jgi:hypothetical protein